MGMCYTCTIVMLIYTLLGLPCTLMLVTTQLTANSEALDEPPQIRNRNYSREALYRLQDSNDCNNDSCPLNNDECKFAQALGIWRKPCIVHTTIHKKRTRRGKHCKRRPWRIPVLITPRHHHQSGQQCANIQNLKSLSIDVLITNRATTEHRLSMNQQEDFVNLVNLIRVNISHASTSKVLLLNCRSVCNKVEAVSEHMYSQNCDIGLLTETWMRQRDPVIANQLCPSGFSVKYKSRARKRGGGVAIVHKSSLKVTTILNDFRSTSFESLVAKLHLPVCIIIAIVYRPPGRIDECFIEEFESLVNELELHSDKFIICGDFNIHVDEPSSLASRLFSDGLQGSSLKQSVKTSTHKSGHTLDLVISRDDDSVLCSDPIVIPNIISDHETILFDIHLEKTRAPLFKSGGRDYRDLNHDLLQDDLNSHLPSIDLSANANDILASYDVSLNNILDSHAPAVTRLRKQNISTPWMTDEIRELRRECRFWERRWHKTHLTIHREIFQNKSHELNDNIQQSKKEYYTTTLLHSDQKEVFRTIRSWTGESTQPLPDVVNVSEAFSVFFESKILRLLPTSMILLLWPMLGRLPHHFPSFLAF